MDKIVLCTCRNDSAFGRLSPRPLQGFCPWTPLDTSVPRPIFLYPPQENTKSSGGGMATGLKASSCFDKVASILLPFLATMSPVWATMSRFSATMSRFLATLSLVWTGLMAGSSLADSNAECYVLPVLWIMSCFHSLHGSAGLL